MNNFKIYGSKWIELVYYKTFLYKSNIKFRPKFCNIFTLYIYNLRRQVFWHFFFVILANNFVEHCYLIKTAVLMVLQVSGLTQFKGRLLVVPKIFIIYSFLLLINSIMLYIFFNSFLFL